MPLAQPIPAILIQRTPAGGAFVHIGKTGGSTLSVLLRNGCHSYMRHPCRNVTDETTASQRIQSYYHVPDFGLLPQSKHDFYLVTVRDPLDRTISGFVYDHYRNQQARGIPLTQLALDRTKAAYSCFPKLETFAGYLEGDPSDFDYPFAKNIINNTSCQDLARAAMAGRVRIFNHLYFGYARIQQLIPDMGHQILLVSRQEHLWSDWQAINRVLGQTSSVVQPASAIRRNMTHLVLPVGRQLSRRRARALCRALADEYRAYFGLLRQAVNVQPAHVEQALAKARHNCPFLGFDKLIV